MNTIIPFPTELRPALPTIVGNFDYLQLRQRLEQMDRILLAGGLETDFVAESLQEWSRADKRPANGRQ